MTIHGSAIFGQLLGAQIESVTLDATGSNHVAAGNAGRLLRFVSGSYSEILFDTGTKWVSLNNRIGDIVTSGFNEANFQAEYGDTWALLDGDAWPTYSTNETRDNSLSNPDTCDLKRILDSQGSTDVSANLPNLSADHGFLRMGSGNIFSQVNDTTALPTSAFTMTTGGQSQSHTHSFQRRTGNLSAWVNHGQYNIPENGVQNLALENATTGNNNQDHTHSASSWGGGDSQTAPNHTIINYFIKVNYFPGKD